MDFLNSLLISIQDLFSSLELWDFLVLVIFLLMLGSLGFFLATLIKRTKKIREEEKKKKYQEEIDRVLFGIMFDSSDSTALMPGFSFSGKSKLFKKVMIKSLIGLHSNFSGQYNSKLERFFVNSGLVEYSVKKMKSKKWVQVVEGIRDLSSLNYQPAYELIRKVKFENNDMVLQEKLIARIRLKGLGELWEFRDSKYYFNDWTQSNILYAIKKHDIQPVDNIFELLHSKNESVALLGVRLIHYYQNLAQLDSLDEFRKLTHSQKLISEINFLLRKKRFSQT